MICFSLVISSCSTLTPSRYEKWTMPEQPRVKPVEFVPFNEITNTNGFFISNDHAINLADNVSELRSYIKKLELLIGEMERYYKEKSRSMDE